MGDGNFNGMYGAVRAGPTFSGVTGTSKPKCSLRTVLANLSRALKFW